MGCWKNETANDGFATPAATMISLVLAITVTAVTTASLSQLVLARSDFEKARIENAITGAQERAILASLSASSLGSLRSTQQSAEGPIDILAEPEAPKTSLHSAAILDDSAFAQLDVSDAGALKTKLLALSIEDAIGSGLEQASQSARWRACARSLISPFGVGHELRLSSTTALDGTARASRTGQVWRFRAKGPAGWVDDRLVRFTGNIFHPAATLSRKFNKLGQEDVQCGSFFKNPS